MMENNEISQIMNEIESEYPAMAGWGVNVVDKREPGHQGQLEFFQPDDSGPPERPNPYLGTPTIEVYNPELKGDRLKQAIMGDMLHYAPKKIPEFSNLRDQFRETMNSGPMGPMYQMFDKNAYQKYRTDYGEKRPYDQWFENSRLDAHIRGKLAPDKEDSWAGSYTPELLGILGQMKETLRRTPEPDMFSSQILHGRPR